MPDRLLGRHPRLAVYFLLGIAVAMIFVLGVAAVQVRQVHTLTGKETRIIAEHAAQRRAQKLDTVNKCFTQAAQGPSTIRFFNVMETVLLNQIASLSSIARRTGEARVTKRLHIAQQSLMDLRNFRAQVMAQTPERGECVRLAKSLGVAVPQ